MDRDGVDPEPKWPFGPWRLIKQVKLIANLARLAEQP